MTTLQTTSTYQLRGRALAAIEAGHEYVFAGEDDARIKIGYAGGGGWIRVEQRKGADLVASATLDSGQVHRQLHVFVSEANSVAAEPTPVHEGVVMAAEAAADAAAPWPVMRAILALLDERVS